MTKLICFFFSKISKSNLKKTRNDVDPCILNRCYSIQICSATGFIFDFVKELRLFKKSYSFKWLFYENIPQTNLVPF